MIRIKREEKIVIRCTAREKEVIKNLANEKGLEVSNFIRYLIEQYKKENQLLEIWKDIKGLIYSSPFSFPMEFMV